MQHALQQLTMYPPSCMTMTAENLREMYTSQSKTFDKYFLKQEPQMKSGLCLLLALTEKDREVKELLLDIAVEAKSMLQDFTFPAPSQVSLLRT